VHDVDQWYFAIYSCVCDQQMFEQGKWEKHTSNSVIPNA
jgi:hypothetical protein